MYRYAFNKLCDAARLTTEISASVIGPDVDHIDSLGNPEETIVWFVSPLTTGEIIHLQNLVTKHVQTINDTVTVAIQEIDSDGAQVVRHKAAKKGWTYSVVPVEFETARRSNKLYSKLADDTDRAGITLKAYDADDNEVTTDGLANINWSTIVKTVIDFEPTYDYEVIGGYVRTINDITADIRLWIVAVPDVPAESGGSKEMVGGLNLNFMKPENVFNVDGRVSKFLAYNATYHTNKLRFILKYPAGTNERIVLNVEHYRQ